MKKNIAMGAVLMAVIAAMLLAAAPISGQETAANDPNTTLWTKPADWPATVESTRTSAREYYQDGKLPTHDPANASDLGLSWQPALRADELGGDKLQDLGGCFCPTLTGREEGAFGNRYRGIHRGHDMGIGKSKLGGRKIPVHAVADGVYDGQRTYTHDKALAKDCKPMVVYHFAADGSDQVYTSIYCHVNPAPELKVGQTVHGGDVIATVEDPEGAWGAHVHLELYTRPVYQSKDSTKFDRCGCKSAASCDAKTRETGEVPRGCGIFEDDLYILDGILFIKKHQK